jgi:uncharacterized protein YqhQ
MPLPEEAPAQAAGSRQQEPFFYGGQAVIEGVMMRGRKHYAVAVRLPRGQEIRIQRGELKSSLYTSRFWKLPFLRGLALLAEQMHLGMKSLTWSAGVNAGDQDVQIGRREIGISMAVALVFSLLLFIGLPLLGAGVAVRRSGSFWFVVVEGLIRVFLILGYLWLIAMLKDVRRVFQYHGAEHKTINAFEAGWRLEVPFVRRASTLHPRCGTGFLLVVVVVSVLLFSFVALLHPNWFWLIASRLTGVPIIAGVSYECIRLMARHRYHPLVRVLLVPVLYTQRFTTREPEDEMLEVAIAAFNAAREGEEVRAA